MLAIRRNHRVVARQRVHHADRDRFFTYIQVHEAADLGCAVQLDALLLETIDAHHRAQQIERVRARNERSHVDVSSVEVSPSGSPSSRAFQQPPHDLAALRLRQTVLELDLLRRNRGAEPFARMGEQRFAGCFVAGESLLQRERRLSRFRRPLGSGFADHRRFEQPRHARSVAARPRRTDQVSRRLDQVVPRGRRQVITVVVATRKIAGQVPVTDETSR